ncbi:MAG: WhiB family transcriptional regulator [Pseudonocardia sp.]|nr:WhiB family transcriptional regulator [Pseudonocardia sp.]
MTRFPAAATAASTSRVLCAADPDRMFPPDESVRPGQAPTAGEWAALAVCRRCPLLRACRAEVLEMALPYGVAGGLTAAERRGIRAGQIRTARTANAGAAA